MWNKSGILSSFSNPLCILFHSSLKSDHSCLGPGPARDARFVTESGRTWSDCPDVDTAWHVDSATFNTSKACATSAYTVANG